MPYEISNGDFKEISTATSAKVLGDSFEAIDFNLKSIEIFKRSLILKYAVTGIENPVSTASRVSKTVCQGLYSVF